MREQSPQGDVAAGGARLRIALGVEAFEHDWIGEFGEHGPDGRVQRELAAFHLLHGAGAGDRLGHRSDPKDRVRRHRLARGKRALAVAALEDRAVSRRRGGGDAGHVAGIGGLLQHSSNLARVGHSHSSHFAWLALAPARGAILSGFAFLGKNATPRVP
jgi:hypothetical protein